MIQKALKYLVDLGEAKEMKINGCHYTDKPVHPIFEMEVQTLETKSLSSVVDFIKEDSKYSTDLFFIQICSPTQVQVLSQNTLSSGKRDCFVLAKTEIPSFDFEKFYSAELFNIKMQSGFLDNADRKAILRMVGNLKDEAVRTLSDDGVTQATVVKTGTATVADVKVPNPVSLIPYRTFTEVDQPESQFVFRMRDGGMCALFEADGFAWKLQAMKNIRAFFMEKLKQEIEIGKILIFI